MRIWTRARLALVAAIMALIATASLVAADPAMVRDHLNQSKTAAADMQKHIDLAMAQSTAAAQRTHVDQVLTYAAAVKKHAQLAKDAATTEPAAADHANDVITYADQVIKHGNLALKAPDAEVKGHLMDMNAASANVMKHLDLALAALPAAGGTTPMPGALPNTGAGGGQSQPLGWIVAAAAIVVTAAGGLFLRRRAVRH